MGVVVGMGGCRRRRRVGLGGSFPAVNDDDSTAVCAEGWSHVILSNVCPSVCLYIVCLFLMSFSLVLVCYSLFLSVSLNVCVCVCVLSLIHI